MKSIRVLLLLLIAAGAVVLIWRHFTLWQLHTEQLQFQQQLEAIAQTVSVPSPIAADSSSDTLSAAERSELLRLRGEAGALRQQLTEATNEMARLSQPPRANNSAPPRNPVTEEEEARMRQKVNRGRQGALALMLYADDHQGRLPGTAAEAVPYLGSSGGILDEFEFVQPGVALHSIQSPSTTIVLREKEPSQLSNGRWSRVYSFADGHAVSVTRPTNDFTVWEERQRPPRSPEPVP
jgi:hypothetical protein